MKIRRLLPALFLAITLALFNVSTILAAGPINVTSSSANGSYNAGKTISIQVVFDQSVTVTGTPQLALNSGGTANYSSGSPGTSLTFTYTVGSIDNSTDLDYVSSNSLTLNGGTIKDGGGVDADLALPDPGTQGSLGWNKNIIIDTIAPTVTNVTSSSSNGSYNAGEAIFIQVSFSEIVNVTSGTPTLALNSSGTANYTSGGPSNTLTFTYTVAAGQTSADLDYSAISSLVGTIKDGAGNSANLTLPTPGAAGSLGANKNIIIDTTAPTIGIGTPSASITKIGPVTYTVTYADTNFNTSTLGTGDITLNTTGGATGTVNVSGSGLTRTVTISSITGNGTIGISIAANTASDTAGNLAPASGASTTFIVDSTPPTITIGSPSVSTTRTGPVTFSVTYADANFNTSTLVTGNISLNSTGGATGTIGLSGSGTAYTVTISSITGNGTLGISIASGTASDLAGNTAPSAGPSSTFMVDNTGPTVTINKAAAQADPTNASPITFTVVFNESVTGFATGDVTLSGTAGATTATVTGSGTNYNVAVSGMTGSGTVIATISAGVAQDAVGNTNVASTSTDNSVSYDIIAPTVTINQAAAQADPTNTSPINFTVVFSETTTDFLTGDVTLSGTAGATTAAVTGSGTNYNVAVSGMTGSGTVIATIAASVAHDAAGNANASSTSNDNSVTYDNTAMNVTINQAAAQADPTNASPINFTVIFTKATTDFLTGDVTLSGTAGATTATVTGSGTNYNVAVSGMTGSGTVIASIAAGAAHDAANNPNTASTSTDNSVTYDLIAPTVTINQAAAQADPTNTSPINFTVVFSETTTDFLTGDVTLSGTAGATTAAVTGSGTNYNVAVSGMTGSGTVIATIAAGAAHDAAGNANTASTSNDNSVTYDNTAMNVTINQATAQADPTNASPINFTVIFTKATTDFLTGDVTLSGTAGATTATVTGSGTTYNVAVSGMTGSGTVIASIAAGAAHDAANNPNTASTSTDNSVTYDLIAPTVTINQAAGQLDPTNTSPINFTVVFSETTTDFLTGDVTLSGTAGATTAAVTGSGTNYNVAVSGMTGSGTVIATIAAGAAHDAAGNANTASTSNDNSVTYDTIAPTVTINKATAQADPTNTSPINFTVVFSEATTDFLNGDVTLGGTAGSTSAVVTGSGTTYNVAVSGMTASGTVIATISASVAHDAAGNLNTASTSTDNSVAYDNTAMNVTINQAATQADPTNTSPINFTVIFTKATTDFLTGDVTLGGTAGPTAAVVTGSGTNYNVAVSGMTVSGTVSVTIAAGVAHDAANNPNAASTSTDNTVAYDTIAPSVTINQAATQTDPTKTTPINFTVTFSETTTDFLTGDVTLGGTAGATTAVVTGSGISYNVAVSGMTGNGTVTANIAADVSHDAAGNANTIGTFSDNAVTYDTSVPVFSTVAPLVNNAYINNITTASDVSYTLSKAISSGTITMSLTGPAGITDPASPHVCALVGGALAVGNHFNFNLADNVNGCTLPQSLVSGGIYTFTFNGTDAAGNAAVPATVTAVTFDNTPPTITIGAPSAPVTRIGPITYTVTYFDTYFSASTLKYTDITLNKTGSANASIAVTGTGTTRTVTLSTISGNGSLGISIVANTASDIAGNYAPASTPSTTFLVDNNPPSVSWIAPVGDLGTYYVSNELLTLAVDAVDDVAISRVVFKRYDYNTHVWVEIGTVTTSPFNFTFDTSVLLLDNNQVDAEVADTANNWTAKYIWLYHLPVLTVTKLGVGIGTVTSSPSGINCGTTCSYGFADNTVVTLTAVATAPSIFTGWSGAGCSGTGTCTVTMNSAKSVSATFSVKYFLPLIVR